MTQRDDAINPALWHADGKTNGSWVKDEAAPGRVTRQPEFSGIARAAALNTRSESTDVGLKIRRLSAPSHFHFINASLLHYFTLLVSLVCCCYIFYFNSLITFSPLTSLHIFTLLPF